MNYNITPTPNPEETEGRNYFCRLESDPEATRINGIILPEGSFRKTWMRPQNNLNGTLMNKMIDECALAIGEFYAKYGYAPNEVRSSGIEIANLNPVYTVAE